MVRKIDKRIQRFHICSRWGQSGHACAKPTISWLERNRRDQNWTNQNKFVRADSKNRGSEHRSGSFQTRTKTQKHSDTTCNIQRAQRICYGILPYFPDSDISGTPYRSAEESSSYGVPALPTTGGSIVFYGILRYSPAHIDSIVVPVLRRLYAPVQNPWNSSVGRI